MSQTVRQIAHNSLFRAIVEGAKLLSGVVLVVILARWLGPSEYGRLSFVLALVTFFSVGLNLGLPLTFVREGARRPEFLSENLSTGLALQTMASLVLLVVLGVGYATIPSFHHDLALLIATLVYTTLSVVSNFLYSFFQAVQRMHLEAIAVLAQNILTAVVVLLFLIARGTAEAAMWGYVAATASSLALTIWLVQKYLFRWQWLVDLRRGRDLLAKSWPLMASLAFGAVYHSLDTVMLRIFQGNTAVGIYSAQYRVVFSFYVFGGWYVFSLLPILASSFVNAKEEFRGLLERSIQHMAGFAYLFGLGVTLFARPIVQTLYGPSYASGILVLQVLVWSAMVSLVGTMFYHALIAAERQQSAMKSVVVGTVAIVIFNLLLIPRFGMLGAAISTVAAQLVQLTMNVRSARSIASIRLFPQILKPSAFALAAVLLNALLYHLTGPTIAASAGWLFYIIACIQSRVLDWREFKKIYTSFSNKSSA